MARYFRLRQAGGCRPAGDNRRFFDGMMWMARTGAQWRHLPPCYGKWNSVFRRYRRWVEQGVFEALLETLAELVGRDRSADMIDSTVVRAHHCAAGKKGAGPAEALGRSRGGFSTKLHARCDARGLPLAFVLTPGQAHDQQGFEPLFRAIGGRLDRLLADRGYDADQIRADISYTGARPVIPAKRGRRNPASHDRHAYKLRNRIERMFNKLKNWRRVATRYDKTAQSYLGFVSIASAFLWTTFVHER
ncbi:IS5 family transposase [Nguyenibacter vanlangensis]|uniref:IS5 family transposase n=1 Tax=Nguyenibacter vanlangensis TaxID=1216886 RepID=A0ABZ3D5I1_9PROT